MTSPLVRSHSSVRALCVVVSHVLLTAAAGAQTLTQIPNLPGGSFMWPSAVSDDGVAVAGDGTIASGDLRAWRWTAATGLSNLGTVGGATGSSCTAMSGNGLVVVGSSGSAYDTASKWTSVGGMQTLGALAAGQPSFAFATNSDGSVIVGHGYLGAGSQRAWKWTSAGGMHEFGQLIPGAGHSVGLGVSPDGAWTIGYCYNNAPSLLWPMACVWSQSGAATPLGTLPDTVMSVPGDLSADGSVVVGYCANADSSVLVPFRWTTGAGIQQLNLLPGTTRGIAGNCTADGLLILGHCLDATDNDIGCVWDAAGSVQPLGAYLQSRGVDTTGWVIRGAVCNASASAMAGRGEHNGLAAIWHASLGIDCTAAPIISTEPVGQSVIAGSTVWFSVGAAGGTLSYQWLKDGAPIGGAVGSGYTIASAAPTDAGTYACTVINACGSTDSITVTLTVTGDCDLPVIVLQPVGETVCNGASVSIFVEADVNGAVSYQWRKDEIDIPGVEDDNTLNLVGVTAADSGVYDCVITNECGSVTTEAVELRVCVADFNCSGSLSVQDVFDFLGAYFAGDSRADFNTSGTVTVQDIFDFLNAYFAGCP